MPHGLVGDTFNDHADACYATIEDQARNDCYRELDRYAIRLEVDAKQGLLMIPPTQ